MAGICNFTFAGLRLVLFITIYPHFTFSKFLATKEQQDLSSALSQSDLLHELEVAVGREHRLATERRLRRLEEAMRPTFNALPKDESGRLGASGVRYMLHRLFVQRHGWFVNSLESGGDAWNSASPTNFIGSHVNPEIQSIFDKELDKHGFDLHHAAVLAATLENFVHIESVERLEAAYKLMDFDPNDANASDATVSRVMKTYALMFVLRQNHATMTRTWIDAALSRADRVYPGWSKTMKFLDEIRESVLEDEESRVDENAPNTLNSWNTTLKVLEKFGEQYGRWQNHECIDMKRMLVDMEEPGTGRVPLHRFYGNGSTEHSKWPFRESIEYLRTLGALDESHPVAVSVIIPNYLNGANNCVAGSKFYDVCCIDECDSLMSHLEERLVASEASPKHIIELVADLASDTVEAPRHISGALSRRLEEIAEHHGGHVPLHGRLFAQWMHHAYPRECPYPHQSGATTSMTSREYVAKFGASASIKASDVPQVLDSIYEQEITKGSQNSDSSEACALPWSSEEELFVRSSLAATGKKPNLHVARSLLPMVFSVLSASAIFYRVFAKGHVKSKSNVLYSAVDSSNHKYFV